MKKKEARQKVKIIKTKKQYKKVKINIIKPN